MSIDKDLDALARFFGEPGVASWEFGDGETFDAHALLARLRLSVERVEPGSARAYMLTARAERDEAVFAATNARASERRVLAIMEKAKADRDAARRSLCLLLAAHDPGGRLANDIAEEKGWGHLFASWHGGECIVRMSASRTACTRGTQGCNADNEEPWCEECEDAGAWSCSKHAKDVETRDACPYCVSRAGFRAT